MTAAIIQLSDRRSLQAAYRQIEDATDFLRRENARIEASYTARRKRIDTYLASIERSAQVRVHDLCPSDCEAS